MEDRLTIAPPAGAGALKVIPTVPVLPAVSVVGVMLTLLSVGNAGGVIVAVALWLVPLYEPVTVVVMVVVIVLLAVIGMLVVVCPAGIVTLAGTLSPLLFVANRMDAPPVDAAPLKPTLNVAVEPAARVLGVMVKEVKVGPQVVVAAIVSPALRAVVCAVPHTVGGTTTFPLSHTWSDAGQFRSVWRKIEGEWRIHKHKVHRRNSNT